MASSSTAPVSRPGNLRTKILRTLVAVVLLTLLGSIAVGAWFYRTAVASLPQLDGELRVAGLSAPVTVKRDAQGTPHIRASTLHDLLFAQGYVTAQDRLWQMDINRRFGRGELSEIFGRQTLRLDKRHRLLQLRQAAENAAKNMTEEERANFEAYASGVNALIKAQRTNLPIEFRVLRYEPRPWTIADSVMIGVNMAEALSTQWDVEYAREKLSKKLSPELMADLYPNGSWRDRWPSMQPRNGSEKAVVASASLAAAHEQPLKTLPSLLPDLCDSCTPGSNNWIISGAHTTKGKPLLANDMHLAHSIPNTWYEAHLTAGDMNVTGFTFPGMPFVIAGHNQRIAWGFTNLGPDVQDLFIETFNEKGEYLTPSGWAQPTRTREVIKVKDASDALLEIEVTRHGPVISDLFPGETRRLSLQWTIYDPATLSMVFDRINRARNWKEFRRAVSNFGGATQNIVYADVDGHIGYQAAGRVPLRKSGDGTLPTRGDDGAHDWMGYVPFEKLPSVYDPPHGVIATANARVTPDGYPYLLANQWGSPYRTQRIYEMLNSGKKFTVADMTALQMDTYSEFDRLFANALVHAVDSSSSAGLHTGKAADVMRAWNGRVDSTAVAPTIANVTRIKLWEMMLKPKLGDDWEDYSWFGRNVALEKILQTKPPQWVPEGFGSFDGILVAALEEALEEAPRNLEQWTWGKRFPISLNHPVFGDIPILNRYAGPGTQPQGGNGSNTVRAAGRSFGASQRATYDLSDWNRSTMNIVTGQSGQIFGTHYMDHWKAWLEGATFVAPYSEQAVNESALHTLRLVPE